MRIFIWRTGFKIRSKADAEKLLNMANESDFGHCQQDFYFHDEVNDYYINPQMHAVFSRPQFCRGNMFSPYFQVLDPVDTIWRCRKYINAQHFAE